MGRIEVPGQNGGLQGMGVPSTQQMLLGLAEQAEWPIISEWRVLQEIKFAVEKQPDGTRVLVLLVRGSRQGIRIPLQSLNAALISKALSGEAVPPSDEVAAAQAGDALDDPPTRPTMGQ